MLKIQTYLNKYCLEKAIKEFNLKTRDYGSKVLIKYDQLSSPTIMAKPEVQECRGIILEKDTWKVMSLAFTKFFNSEEGNAHKIDWDTAQILEKLDGSLIQVYYDWNNKTWFAATTGTAEGCGLVNNKMGTTFNSLFWDTVSIKYGLNIDKLTMGYTYVFELCTPYNIVVKPHGESSATLLTVRNLNTLKEVSRDELLVIGSKLNVPVVSEYDINANDVGKVKRLLDGLPWSFEGYVVVDGNFNRIKVKNPSYIAVHYLKGKTGEHNILSIVKSNEIEEFVSIFPDRKDELYRLKKNYDLLVEKLNTIWSELLILKPKNITKEEKKRYAMEVFSITRKYELKQFSGLYFGLVDGKIKSVEDFVAQYDDKILYALL